MIEDKQCGGTRKEVIVSIEEEAGVFGSRHAETSNQSVDPADAPGPGKEKGPLDAADLEPWLRERQAIEAIIIHLAFYPRLRGGCYDDWPPYVMEEALLRHFEEEEWSVLRQSLMKRGLLKEHDCDAGAVYLTKPGLRWADSAGLIPGWRYLFGEEDAPYFDEEQEEDEQEEDESGDSEELTADARGELLDAADDRMREWVRRNWKIPDFMKPGLIARGVEVDLLTSTPSCE